MKSLILDTNVFLRFLLNDNLDLAKEVTDILVQAKSKKLKIIIPQIIIFEINFALEKYYKFPKNEVIDKIGIILKTEYLHIQDRVIFQEALELFKNKKIDFVDCFLISKSRVENSKLFTFDKDLQKLA